MIKDARSNIRREQSQSEHEPDSVNCSATRSTLESDEHQPERGYRALGSSNRCQSRPGGVGGILNQLRRLQSDYLAYIETHGQHLKRSLQENHEHKQKVLTELEVLENELLDLLEKEINPDNQLTEED